MGGLATEDSKPLIVVIGGSYCGLQLAQELASTFHEDFQVLVIEQQTHFQHLFAFTRFSVCSGLESRKAFIPFNPGTFAACPEGSGKVVQAAVLQINKRNLVLDRPVQLFSGAMTDTIAYAYLIVATGCKLSPPSNIPSAYPGKQNGITYLERHAQKVIRSKKIVIIGAGAVGVQIATDCKELYPEKDVTLVHSRQKTMVRFHDKLDDIVKKRAEELGLGLVLGSRAIVPKEGFPEDGTVFDVCLEDGRKISADLVITCTGYTPRSELVKALSPGCVDEWGYVKVRPTLQVADRELANIFAVGDVADTGAPKAGWCSYYQGKTIAANIRKLMTGEKLESYEVPTPGILLTLGIHKSVIFRDPGHPGDKPGEPFVDLREDGHLDRDIDVVWKYRHGGDDYDA